MEGLLREARGGGEGGELAALELREKSLSTADLALLRAALEDRSGRCARLAFHRCNLAVFQRDGLEELCAGLEASPRLRELAFVHCFVDAAGARGLRRALAHTSALTLLHIERCGLSSFGMAELCAGLAAGLAARDSPPLQDLILAHNSLGLVGAQALAAALAAAPELRALDATGCCLTASGTHWLAQGLGSCTRLQELVLAHNPIGDAGAAELAASALLRPRDSAAVGGLRRLSVEQCGLTEQGVRELCEALLPTCAHLADLNLSHNRVSDSAAGAIARLLAGSAGVRKLALAGCQGLSPRGITLICQGLKACPTYADLELHLEHNDGLGDAGARVLAQLDLGVLRLLNLRKCAGITNRGRLSLAKTLRARPPPLSRNFQLIGVSLSRVWQQLEPPIASPAEATCFLWCTNRPGSRPDTRACAEEPDRDTCKRATWLARPPGESEEGEDSGKSRERRRASNSRIVHFWRQRVERDVAFCMVAHSRLGSASMWSGLDDLLVQALLTSFQTLPFQALGPVAGEDQHESSSQSTDEDQAEDPEEGKGEEDERWRGTLAGSGAQRGRGEV